MPPHCDALDGPVVNAARRALATGDVNIVLPYVKEDAEDEVKRAFERVAGLVSEGSSARDVAELYFFETVVRLHRAGESAPYTGLKPAGLDVGPVIPIAERAIETGSWEDLADLLCRAVRDEVEKRYWHLKELEAEAGRGLPYEREYVQAMLGLQVWSHKLNKSIYAAPHEPALAHRA